MLRGVVAAEYDLVAGGRAYDEDESLWCCEW